MRFGAPSLGTRRRLILKWLVLAATIIVALAIDLITKQLAEQRLVMGELHEILPFFYLQRTVNSGVAFGLLGGRSPFIIVANVVALLIVLAYVVAERRPILAGISGGLIIGGSLGNLVQRLAGERLVTDFLKFPHWPNFNMADVFLFVGIAAIVVGLVLEMVRVWKEGSRQTPAPR